MAKKKTKHTSPRLAALVLNPPAFLSGFHIYEILYTYNPMQFYIIYYFSFFG